MINRNLRCLALTAGALLFTAIFSGAAHASQPYSGSAIAVPSTFEAENFDRGGQNAGYNDNVPGNAGGKYRPAEDVDIINTADSSGSYDVNNFETGEWLAYTIDAGNGGRFQLALRSSSAFSDSAYRVEIDGKAVGGSTPVYSTSGWDTYKWQGKRTLWLTPGRHVLTIIADREYFNLNSLRLERIAGSTPYYGKGASMPGILEAEDFDLGGEGAAYHDNVRGNAGGQYRNAEDVDIVASFDGDGGTYDVNNFETGEWLAYSIEVRSGGTYFIELRASSYFDDSAFHVEVDGADVSGRIAVANTGGWHRYEWFTAARISLSPGPHILKIVADKQYFNVNRIAIGTASRRQQQSTPWAGQAAPMPGVMPAVNFDVGGEGVAYHDNVPGNAGDAYRQDEDVDIVPAGDTSISDLDVNNFETGEWMAYTVDVARSGTYDVDLRVASAFGDSAMRIEIDGKAAGGSIAVTNTGSWRDYAWVGARGAVLDAGQHTVRVTAENQYFNVNALRIQATQVATPVDPATILFNCTFPGAATDCGFREQAKATGRARIVNKGRHGNTGILLRTEPGDNNVAGSGNAERTDLYISRATTDGNEGSESWWAHSIMFPDDYVQPPSGWGVVFDFHNTASGAWQANFHVDAGPHGLDLRGYGGANSYDGEYGVQLGQIQRNVWYDFVYHVRWSSGSDGFMEAWVNGEKVLAHYGPTLYAGQGVYLKLANYHSPFGQASSVIHDRIMHGTSALAVSDRPLDGVLELVNGVLVPIL